jgi:hypothetical protein
LQAEAQFSNLNESDGDYVDNATPSAVVFDDDNDAEMEDALATAVHSAGASGVNSNRSATKSSSAYTLHAHKVIFLVHF